MSILLPLKETENKWTSMTYKPQTEIHIKKIFKNNVSLNIYYKFKTYKFYHIMKIRYINN